MDSLIGSSPNTLKTFFSMVLELIKAARKASKELLNVDHKVITLAIEALADELVLSVNELLHANQSDIELLGEVSPMVDRLMLNEQRIISIAADLRRIAKLPSPQGKILERKILDNGLDVRRMAVPFGVVGMVYESRPNVTFDAFTLCLKSGNVAVLKGGSDAYQTNKAAVSIIKRVLHRFGLSGDMVCLLPTERDATLELIRANGFVDMVIPRGGQSLIRFVRENATVPTIETGAGICHTYFSRYGDKEKGKAIVTNAKLRRVSVCNALDCLIIDSGRLLDLPFLCSELAGKGVTIYADEAAHSALQGNYPAELLELATAYHYGIEFLDYKMSVKTAAGIGEATEHIDLYGSRHSECIVSENGGEVERFISEVDAAVVYANASTAFTDGGELGLGAEVGISTQKLHARGPMGLEALVTYKWIVKGDGQIR